MESKHIVTHINLKADETLYVGKTTKANSPNYYRIGNGTMNRQKIKSIDLLTEFYKCSKPAQTVILWIKEEMTWCTKTEKINFIAKVVAETTAQKQILKKGLKELFCKDLVRRVKRGCYMINPNAIITDYEAQMEVWDTLTPTV